MNNLPKRTYQLIDALMKLPDKERIAVMNNCFQIISANIKDDTNFTGHDIPNVLSSDDMKLTIEYLNDVKKMINIINPHNDSGLEALDELIAKLSNQQFASIIFQEVFNSGGGIEVEIYKIPNGKVLMLSESCISMYGSTEDISEKEPLAGFALNPEPANDDLTVSVKCRLCSNEFLVACNSEDYGDWRNGKLIQSAMPYLSAGDRELLISQTCPACWEKMKEGMENEPQ